MAVDAAGDLFIADSSNNVVREVVKATGDIITVAGNGVAGYSGDGGPAIDAELSSPLGIAVNAAGDLFIADNDYNVIREVVLSTGTIFTVAGTSDPNGGYGGDGGPATAAQFDNVRGLATDAAGDLFITDADNGAIRRVTPAAEVLVEAASRSTNLGASVNPSAVGQSVTSTATASLKAPRGDALRHGHLHGRRDNPGHRHP